MRGLAILSFIMLVSVTHADEKEYSLYPVEDHQSCFAVIEIVNRCRMFSGGSGDLEVGKFDTDKGPVTFRYQTNESCWNVSLSEKEKASILPDVFEVLETPEGVFATPPIVETMENGETHRILLCTGFGV